MILSRYIPLAAKCMRTIFVTIFFISLLLWLAPSSGVLADNGSGTGPGGVGSTDGSSELGMWLKADSGVYTDIACTQIANDGELVACWADHSGNALDAKQSAAGQQPLYESDPLLQFNGTDTLLSTSPVSLFSTSSSGLAAFIVFQTDDKDSESYLLNHGASSEEADDRNFELGYRISAAGDFGLHRGNDHATLASAGTITNSTYTILNTHVLTTSTSPADSIEIYKNGDLLTLSTSSSGWLEAGNYATATVSLDIGARRDGNASDYPNTINGFHDGSIREIILYQAPLNTAQRIIVENYLSTKYAIDLISDEIYDMNSSYTQDFAGIGRENDGTHTEAHSAGLILQDSGILKDDGDYVVVAHNSTVNTLLTDDSNVPDVFESRWLRIWQLYDKDVNLNHGALTLKFDLSEGGIGGEPEDLYTLIHRGGYAFGTFEPLRTSGYIVGDQIIFSATLGMPSDNDEFYTLAKLTDPKYDVVDSTTPGGPTYAFESITSTGTYITFTAVSKITGAFPLDFSFNYYEEDYTEIYIGSNGFLTFLPSQTEDSKALPLTDAPNGVIAGWWENLRPDSAGTVQYQTLGTAPNRRFIVQFTDVIHAVSFTDPVTFQFKLFETSNIIEVHYKDAPFDNDAHWAGIEDQTGQIGIPYYALQGSLENHMVRYTPRPMILKKTVSEDTPRAGDRITYTLELHSNLTQTTSTTVISETLDAGLVFIEDAISIDPPQSMTIDNYGQTLVFSDFSIIAGKKITLTIPVTVSVDVTPGLHLRNTAVVTHGALSTPLEKNVTVIADNCWAKVSSSGTVYENVQTAVDAAVSGDMVKIAGYCIDVEAREDLYQTLYLSKTVTLQGGYATERVGEHYTVSDWNTVDLVNTPTTLDAQARGRLIYMAEASNLTLNGLRLIGGDANIGGGGLGGAMFVYSATAVIGDAMVYSNSANEGGGVYVDAGSITFADTQIFSNTAVDGGGLYFSAARAITLTDNFIVTNTATSDGGGVYLLNIDTFTSTQNLLRGNVAQNGGGIYLQTSSSVMDGFSVISNTANRNGGGMYLSQSTAQFSQLKVISNTASTYGGGIYTQDSDAIFDTITVTLNSAASRGGGGYFNSNTAAAALTNAYIVNNSSGSGGGGWYLDNSDVIISDTIIFSNTAASYGGGLYVKNGTPILTNNVISANVAKSKGGGLYLDNNSALLSENRIEANRTISSSSTYKGGGGIHIYRGSPILTENVITLNVSDYGDENGGGLYLRGTTGSFNDNRITSNTAEDGGGIFIIDSGSPTLNGNRVTSNIALGQGGGLYVSSGTPSVVGHTFEFNHADRGGGLYLASSNYEVADNFITSNTADVEGGGVFVRGEAILLRNSIRINLAQRGGGIYINSSDPVLDGNLVEHNTAGTSGGGVYLAGSAATLMNNFIVENEATDHGSGVYIVASTPHLLHTTLASNTDGDGTAIYVASSSLSYSSVVLTNTILSDHTVGVYASDRTTVTLNTLVHYNNTLSWDGDGIIQIQGKNLEQAPVFVAVDDYHITVNSPAIDTGVSTNVTSDFDGDARPLNAGYDMGADEYTDTCFVRLNDVKYYYLTVQNAVDAAEVGDIVKVAGYCPGVSSNGVTTQTLVVTKSVTIRGGYTLTNWLTPEPILNPTTLDALGQGRVIYVTDGASVTFESLRITGGAATEGGGIYVDSASVNLEKLLVYDNTSTDGAGLYLRLSDANLINSLFVDNQASQDGGGVYVRGSSPVFLHTTLARNTDDGIYVTNDGSTYSTIALTNTILVAHSVGVTAMAGNTANLNYTLRGSGIWSNGTFSTGAGTITSFNEVVGDPDFIEPDEHNYHLSFNSAAKDVGIDVGVTDDFDWDHRSAGSGYDIGADEFTAAYRLDKTATPNPAIAGESLEYTLWVTNTGAVDIEGIVRDNLQGPISPTGEMVYAMAANAAGGVWKKTITVMVVPTYTGLLTNTIVSTTTLDVNHSYTQSMLVTTKADLVINKSGVAREAVSGTELTYTLSYTNDGPSIAFDVVVSDTVPNVLGNLQVTHSGALITSTGSVNYSWDVEPLVPGAGGMITITGLVIGGQDGQVFTNTATIFSSALDENLSNNTSAPITATASNSSPIAQDDIFETDEDVPASFDVLDNDDDPDGDSLAIAAIGQPAHGTATTNGITAQYTPTLDYFGSDVFTYTVGDNRGKYDIGTVDVTILPVNDPPVANDDTASTAQEIAVEIDVLANDEDNDDVVLTITVVTVPAHGTATTNGATIIYTPTTGYTGTDAFTYTIEDSETASDSAIVTVTITDNWAPIAVDDVIGTLESTPVIIPVLANDVDPNGNPLFIIVVGTPSNGIANIVGDTIVYTPSMGFTGIDTFGYTISDGGLTDEALVTVSVLPPTNAPPQAFDDTEELFEDTSLLMQLLSNDIDDTIMFIIHVGDPLHGLVETVTYSQTRYTPDEDFSGNDTFTYTVSDGQYTASATVNLTVTAVNDAPSFTPGMDITVNEDDGAQSFPGWASAITAGPADESGQVLNFDLTHTRPELFSMQPAVDATTGDLIFTPAPEAHGSVMIFAMLQDNGGTTNGGVDAITHTFNITITPQNDPPRFTSLPVELVGVDQVYTYAIVASDAGDGDILTITAPIKPTWLVFTSNGESGILSGVPVASDIGVHPVTLEVRDSTGLTDTQIFSIVVSISPSVLTTQPEDAEQNVTLDVPIIIAFSEAINTSTFAYEMDPNPGGWSLAWSSNDTIITLDHTAFVPETTYVFTISAAYDLDGVALNPLPYMWTFESEASSQEIYLPLVIRNAR